jgi:hypothetical protein
MRGFFGYRIRSSRSGNGTDTAIQTAAATKVGAPICAAVLSGNIRSRAYVTYAKRFRVQHRARRRRVCTDSQKAGITEANEKAHLLIISDAPDKCVNDYHANNFIGKCAIALYQPAQNNIKEVRKCLSFQSSANSELWL